MVRFRLWFLWGFGRGGRGRHQRAGLAAGRTRGAALALLPGRRAPPRGWGPGLPPPGAFGLSSLFVLLLVFIHPLQRCQFLLLNLSLFDLLFLLLKESCRDSSDVLLCAQQQWPEVLHELAGVLTIQETRQVDLHHFTVRVLQHTQPGEKREGKRYTSQYRGGTG